MKSDNESELIIEAFYELVDELDNTPLDFKERDLQSRLLLKIQEKFNDIDFWKRMRVEHHPYDTKKKEEARNYAENNQYKYLENFKKKERGQKKKTCNHIIKNGGYDISIYKDSQFDVLTHAIEIKRLTSCSGHQGIEDIYVLTDMLTKYHDGARGYSFTIVWPPKNSKKSDEYIEDINKAFENTKRGNHIYYYGIIAPKKDQPVSRDQIIEGGKALS